MSFTIRDANVNDALALFEMIEAYHSEVNIRNKPFTISKNDFIKDCFEDKSKIKFFIVEFNGNVLGYCAYVVSYSILNGPSMIVKEIYVKPDYRKIGVSVFVFSKIIDTAFKNNSHYVHWVVDISDKKLIEVEEKAGVVINRDILILNIYREDIKRYLQAFFKDNPYEIRLAKAYELPDVFECVNDLANVIKEKVHTDVYKLMSDGFSMNPKFKILVVTIDNMVSGFMSFFESYSTYCGKTLIVDQVFVREEKRGKGLAHLLLTGLFQYAYNNGYTKVETSISQYEVEKIERLKEVNVYPYDNLRVAHYVKEEYKKLYNN
jgi:GNAT superfamily N-acetyltransferase